MGIAVIFPRPKSDELDDKPEYVYRLSYGRNTPPSGIAASPDEPRHIKPGEEVDLTLPVEDTDDIRATLTKLGYPGAVLRIKLSIGPIIFEDDSMWEGDHIHRRDPENPDSWKPIKQTKNSTPNHLSKSVGRGFSILEASLPTNDSRGVALFSSRKPPLSKSASLALQNPTSPCNVLVQREMEFGASGVR